ISDPDHRKQRSAAGVLRTPTNPSSLIPHPRIPNRESLSLIPHPESLIPNPSSRIIPNPESRVEPESESPNMNPGLEFAIGSGFAMGFGIGIRDWRFGMRDRDSRFGIRGCGVAPVSWTLRP